MKRISSLIASIESTPDKGIGKPEQLKYELSGTWSRRIDRENRITYEIHEDHVLILAMKGHYEKITTSTPHRTKTDSHTSEAHFLHPKP